MFVLASLSRVLGTSTSTFAQIVFYSFSERAAPTLLLCVSFFFFSSKQRELNRRGKQRVERVEEVNGQGDGIWTAATAGLFVWEEEAAGGQQGTTGDIWDKDDIWCFKTASLLLEMKYGSAVCSGFLFCLICFYSHLSRAKSILDFFLNIQTIYICLTLSFFPLFFKTIHVRDEFSTSRRMLNIELQQRLRILCIMQLFLIISTTTGPFLVLRDSERTARDSVELLHIQLLDSSNFHFPQSLKLGVWHHPWAKINNSNIPWMRTTVWQPWTQQCTCVCVVFFILIKKSILICALEEKNKEKANER